MGANHVYIRLPFFVHFRRRFRTTNGKVYFSIIMNSLIIYDACVVLAIDPVTRDVSYLLPPDGWYFADFSETDDQIKIKLWDGGATFREQRLAAKALEFQIGTGPVRGGCFPSAYPK